ncbi:YdeI/OmpD-associated family protein [Microlunatus sp. Y2014]|uniref:YdeI/OmpD-associated family protein n=1 Tax=Microlunatus sp. Y2014 TaxID=3418488 RepID=UPI003DA77EB9
MTRTDPGTPGGTDERPGVFFADAAEFRTWLELHHETATELWMGLYKKHVPDRGLTWAEAVPVALCFGWIDSVSQRIDDDARRQRWTPRKADSNWSEVNIKLVGELTAAGLMHPAGIAAFERRRADRSGIYSYESSAAGLPPEYEALLRADDRASMFWDAATNSYRRLASNWVLSAKQQTTRDRRIRQLIDNSASGQVIPSQRYGDEPKWVAKVRARLDGD